MILGTGFMAGNHAEAFGADDDCEVVAAADIDPAALAAFQRKYGIDRGFADTEEALAWEGRVNAALADPYDRPALLSMQVGQSQVLRCARMRRVAVVDANDLTITEDGSDLRVRYGSNSTVILENTTSADIDIGNFQFDPGGLLSVDDFI